MRNVQKIVWLVKVEISKSDLSGWAVFTFGEDEATLVHSISRLKHPLRKNCEASPTNEHSVQRRTLSRGT